MRMRIATLVVAGLLSGAALARGAQPLIDAMEASVEAGQDARPAIDALLTAIERSRDEDDVDDMLDAIEAIGDADGTSPQAVKQYIREKAPEALRAVFQGNFSWSLKGDAIMLHRTIEASDADLKAAIALAMADTSAQAGYLNSRGELLQNWLDSRSPARRAELDAAPPADAAAASDALAQARAMGLSVSLDQLMSSAREGKVDEVRVLLDAGLDVNARTSAWTSALSAAATGNCAAPEVPIARNLEVMDLLIERGADPDAFDELNNSILMRAAQQCPVHIVQRLLDGGAEINPVNRQDFTPLEMALVLGKLDTAELLVARGARRGADKLERIFVETPSDPRLQAIIATATGVER